MRWGRGEYGMGQWWSGDGTVVVRGWDSGGKGMGQVVGRGWDSGGTGWDREWDSSGKGMRQWWDRGWDSGGKGMEQVVGQGMGQRQQKEELYCRACLPIDSRRQQC